LILLDPIQRVRVRLRGRTSQIRALNPLAIDVLVAIPEAHKGMVDVRLGPENVVVPGGIVVESIEPNQLQLRLDRELTRTLPVKVKLMGEPAAGAQVQKVEVSPSTAQVSGPESLVSSLQWITTANVNLNGHALDFEETAAVLAPDPLVKVLQPLVVTVRVPMQPPGLTSPVHPPREKHP
jgi:hypothetical protein